MASRRLSATSPGLAKRDTVGGADAGPFWDASNDLLHWLWSWSVQFQRLIASTRLDGNGTTPTQKRQAFSRTSLDEHLLAVVGGHVVKALGRYDATVPPVSLGDQHLRALELLRNLYEHWDDQRPAMRPGGPPKKRSAKLFAEEFPTGRPFSITYAEEDWLLGGVVPLQALSDALAALEEQVLVREAQERKGSAG